MKRNVAVLLVLGAGVAGLWFLGYGRNAPKEYVPQVPEAPASAAATSTTILFVGDIMLGRHVETLSERNGADYPFHRIESLLASADYTVANLEGPIVEGAPKTPIDGFQFAFPTSTPKLLARRGVRVVSLANNHGVDQGQAGYEETVRRLGEEGISSAGHPLHIPEGAHEALSSVVVPPPDGSDVPLQVYVAFNATFPSFSLDEAKAFVGKTRQNYPDAFLAALIHWGDEYKLVSSPLQREIAHDLADSGADLIIGHHPHVVEEIERYKDTTIFYSLGNFIFDQYFSDDVEEGLTVRMRLGEGKVSYELIPVNGDRKSQPRMMEVEERVQFLKALAKRSSGVAERVRNGSLEFKTHQ
jgi:gamma-polyglutamate biosynthesis protein CapA